MTLVLEADLDAASRPLRDVLPRWAHERGLGWSGGWRREQKDWCYALAAVAGPRHIVVLVAEDGSRAIVQVYGERDSVATTPRGLYCALTKRWEAQREEGYP